MSPEIQTIIQVCNWSSSHFLIISDNVFSPLLYYSYFGSVIPSLLIAFFVFFKGPKKLANRLLLLMVLSFAVWVFGALVVWATEIPAYTMFFWSLLVLVEPLVYFLAFYFIYVLLFDKDFSILKKIAFSTPLFATVILTPTNFGLLGYNLSDCERNAVEGILATYGYAIELLYVFLILGFAIYFINTTKDIVEKKKTILITTGIVAFLLSFSLGNIIEVFSDNWYIGQYGLFGAPVFVGFLAYTMVRYKTFNVKLIGAQALVATLWIALFSVLFVGGINNIGVIVVCITLILLLVIGILLVRSVSKEIKQREEIAQLAERVKKAYETEKKAKEDISKAYVVEKQAKDELEKLDKIKNQFLAQTQHDLRTPLGIIRDYCDLLIGGTFGKQPKKAVDVIKRVQVVAENKIKDVNNFLDTTQFQLGKKVVLLKPDIELNTIMDEIMTGLEDSAKAKKIYLKFEKPEKKFIVEADREKLKAAIYNIIDNSIKYTAQGGVEVKLENHDTVKISVSDTGIGIPHEKLATLFDTAFERSKEAKEASPTGRGIGLYLSSQIIKAHNGKVWVESEGLGKGSVFHVELPLQKDAGNGTSK